MRFPTAKNIAQFLAFQGESIYDGLGVLFVIDVLGEQPVRESVIIKRAEVPDSIYSKMPLSFRSLERRQQQKLTPVWFELNTAGPGLYAS